MVRSAASSTKQKSAIIDNLGIVAIGRNEGDRLIRCLDSLQTHLPTHIPIIYVDSGSTDNSVQAATQRGVEVVTLDMSIPFTGARARNAGFKRLLKTFPTTQYVQFIDGDCELLDGWIERANATLQTQPNTAIVFGRLRERHPNATLYNQLANMEWAIPPGEVKACGGIALARTAAIQATNGYNPTLICGEEPELCLRLRRLGWQIHCIDADMATHDIAMHHFSAWWKRATRYGWAVAQGYDMYGNAPEKYKQKEHRSGWLWGAIIPIAALILAIPTSGISLLILLALYAVQIFKIYKYRKQRHSSSQALLYASFCILSKIPQAIGQGKYWQNKRQSTPAELIEYKR